MDRLFLDTSYWIALLNPRDHLHAKAGALSQQLESSRIVTSEMVLTELLNSFSDPDSRLREAAASTVNSLRRSSDVVIVPQTPEPL